MQRSLRDILADYDAARPLERAFTIPASWYIDARMAELERRAVFGRAWQPVARLDRLAWPGCYVTADIAGEPVLVVRGKDGALRAFYNVCRHHATILVGRECGQAQNLRCPYHGWTYDLAGRLRGVTDWAGVEDFDRKDHGLVPVALDTFAGFVFVCLDPDATPLSGWYGELADRVAALDLDRLRFHARRTYTLDCNWKVFVDNYLDGGYHVPHMHPGLSSVLDYAGYTITNGSRYCVQESPMAQTTTTEAEVAEVAEVAAVRQGQRAFYLWLYPAFMINVYQDTMDSNLVLPLGVDRCAVVFDFYFADVSAAAQASNEASIAVAERVQREDEAICAAVQRGLGSRAYQAGRLSVRREAGEHLFHRLLHADLVAELDRDSPGTPATAR